MSNPVIKHQKELTIPDGTDPDVVRPSDWNATHTLTQKPNRMLGRVTAGAGATEELTPEQARTVIGLGTAALATLGTASGEVPTNADLGTAAQADIGTEPDQVPTNDMIVIPEVTQSDTRQTVSAGPVDADGRADFLQAGTGLEVVSKDVGESDPLHLTWGDGFSNGSKLDLATAIDESFAIGSLPDDEDYVGLWAELDPDTGTVTFGHTLLKPSYEYTRPTSPATGQMHYHRGHIRRAEVWDGSEWVPTYRVMLGECATTSGSVTDVRSYAYRGEYYATQETVAANTGYSFSDNIGAKSKIITLSFVLKENINGFVIGDKIQVTNSLGSSAASANDSHTAAVHTENSCKVGVGGRLASQGFNTSVALVVTFVDTSIEIIVRRSF